MMRLLLICSVIILLFSFSAPADTLYDDEVITTRRDLAQGCHPTLTVALGLNNVVITGNVQLNTNETDCGSVISGKPVVPLVFTAPSAGRYHFSTDGARVDTVLEMRNGAACTGLMLSCNNDDTADDEAEISVSLLARQTVTVVLAMSGGNAFPIAMIPLTIRRESCIPSKSLRLGELSVVTLAFADLQHSPLFYACDDDDVRQVSQIVKFTAPVTSWYQFHAQFSSGRIAVEARLESCTGESVACLTREPSPLAFNISLGASQTVFLRISDDDSDRMPPTASITVTSSATQPLNIANLCRPAPSLSKNECYSRDIYCSLWGYPLKWVPSCRGRRRGLGGCQCEQFCGYKCRGACVNDLLCTWRGGKCFARGSSVPAGELPTC